MCVRGEYILTHMRRLYVWGGGFVKMCVILNYFGDQSEFAVRVYDRVDFYVCLRAIHNCNNHIMGIKGLCHQHPHAHSQTGKESRLQ